MKNEISLSYLLTYFFLSILLTGCIQQPILEKNVQKASGTSHATPIIPSEPQSQSQYEEVTPVKTPAKEETNLENFAWNYMPSWDIIDASAADINRNYVPFIKGAVSQGLWVPERGERLKNLIADNFSMKERINANTYKIQLTLGYRNGSFRPAGPDFITEDEFLRSIFADGVLAKRRGFAVYLMANFNPETMRSKEELLDALDSWDAEVSKLAKLAEKYRFEFFDPFGELDNIIRNRTGLTLSEQEIVEILNKYYTKYLETARKYFKGKIVTQLGDVYPELENSILDLNLSSYNMVGMLTGTQVSMMNQEEFHSYLKDQIKIMNKLSSEQNVPWFISEVWIYDTKPETKEKLEKQAELFSTLFDTLDSSDANFHGVLIMNWNFKEPDIFASIKDTQAEQIVAEYFSKH